VRVTIAGAAGRMGRRLVALAAEMNDVELVGAFDAAGHPDLGADAGQLAGIAANGVPLADAPAAGADAVIDFSLPEATSAVIQSCVDQGTALVLGTTGLSAAHHNALDDAAGRIPIVQATNFSLVVNVLNVLAARAARLLGDDYDIELVEAHHKHKKDAPSGTALTLARTICEATGRDFDRDVIYGRHGDDAPRRPREIAVQALRLGDVVGEHTVMFAAPGERMELKHIGTSRDSYATGALRPAVWLRGRAPGRYTMNDVLGLD